MYVKSAISDFAGKINNVTSKFIGDFVGFLTWRFLTIFS